MQQVIFQINRHPRSPLLEEQKHQPLQSELSAPGQNFRAESTSPHLQRQNFAFCVPSYDKGLSSRYDALKGNEEEVDEPTHELEVTMDSLESAQSALRESQSQVEELTVALSLAQSSSSMDTIEFPIAALVMSLHPRVVVMGVLRMWLHPSLMQVSAMTDDTGQIVDSSCVAVVDSPESCVLVHDVTPSTSHGTRIVSSGWEYGSHVDLFPSPRSKSVTSSHAADFGRQLVVPQSQSDQLQVLEDKRRLP
ncbi:hypothetical protein SUGI_0598150 [Cryptomeria japonica]|nr:hypothetical protein SUGI_0598150 [Cryptomeria japonica]